MTRRFRHPRWALLVAVTAILFIVATWLAPKWDAAGALATDAVIVFIGGFLIAAAE